MVTVSSLLTQGAMVSVESPTGNFKAIILGEKDSDKYHVLRACVGGSSCCGTGTVRGTHVLRDQIRS